MKKLFMTVSAIALSTVCSYGAASAEIEKKSTIISQHLENSIKELLEKSCKSESKALSLYLDDPAICKEYKGVVRDYFSRFNFNYNDLITAGISLEDISNAVFANIKFGYPNFLDDAVRVLRSPNCSVQTVYLTWTDMDACGFTVAGILKHNTSIKHLYMLKTDFRSFDYEFIAQALESNTSLETLVISYGFCESSGTKAFGNALKKNKTLLKLDLHGSRICKQGAIDLAEGLSENTTLRELNLADNDCLDGGAIGFADVITKNTSLQILNLSGNDIGDVGGRALSRAFATNTSLTLLNLRHNKMSGAFMTEWFFPNFPDCMINTPRLAL